MNQKLTEQMIKGIQKATPKDELEFEVVDDTPKADRIVSLLSRLKRSLKKSLKIIRKKFNNV